MPRSCSILHSIAQLLAEGESLMLATIVSRAGSAPRAVGARMLIRPDGTIVGTIGGGILEARVQALARDVPSGQAVLKKYVLTNQDAGQMGMVCGGVVQVLVQSLDTAKLHTQKLYREIVSTLEAREKAWLVVAMPSGLDTPETIAQGLMNVTGMVAGDLDQDVIQSLLTQALTGRPELFPHQGKRYLADPLSPQSTVYIFGAGHVAQQLAPLAKKVGFRTLVLDDREEFANRERFPNVDEVIVLPSFDVALEGLEIDGDSYLVLVTRGHAYDQTVLRQALATPACYIGMIASRRKRDAIYAALGQEGFSRPDFDRINSPIGLAIGAETPEEIAVSIVAELIQIRAAKNR